MSASVFDHDREGGDSEEGGSWVTTTSRQVGSADGIREEGLGTQGQQHTDSLVPRRSFVQAPASEQRSGGLWTRGRRWPEHDQVLLCS